VEAASFCEFPTAASSGNILLRLFVTVQWVGVRLSWIKKCLSISDDIAVIIALEEGNTEVAKVTKFKANWLNILY